MKQRHKLFRAMVTMGGSLALGCGGVSARSEVDNVGGDGGSSGTQSSPGAGGVAGGAASTGSATGTGNSTSGGDTSSTGGSVISIPTGGTSGTGQALVEPGPFTCPPEHWNCSASPPSCGGYAEGWQLPTNCACEPGRPTTASDCPPGEGLVCRRGRYDSQGRQLTRDVPFECSCAPLITDCSVCEQVFPNYGDGLSCEQHLEDVDTALTQMTLCGCAIVYLR